MGRLIGYLFAGFCTLSLLYSNCGRVGQGGLITAPGVSKIMSSTQMQCELARKEAYSKTFFPFLKDTCTRCHQHTQTHASLNLDTSYAAFMQTGQQTIIYQATHPHGGNSFGAANQAAIDAFLPDWTAAGEEYVDCMARNGETAGPTIVDVRLTSQTIANIETTRADPAVWVPMTYDLPYPGSTLTIEARYWLNVRSEVIGLQIRKPRIKIAAGQAPIRFQGLQIFINDVLRQSATMYASLHLTLAAGSDTLLSGGTDAIGISGVTSSVLLGIQLTQVEKNPGGERETFQPTPTATPVGATPTPTPVATAAVTFSDLVSGPIALRIFGNSCVGCHNANTPSGHLDLTKYSSAFDKASTILARMKSTTNPMPQSGNLSPEQIDKVQAWIAAGKPQ